MNTKILIPLLIALNINTASAISLSVVGQEEVVFDYSSEKCEAMDIPDASPRMIRTREGIKLFSSSYSTYAATTQDFDDFSRDCQNPAYTSGYQDNYFTYRDREWPTSFVVSRKYPSLVYSIIHGEYHGHLRFGQCNNDYAGCWQNYLTSALSFDGMRSLDPTTVSLLATTTQRYLPNRGPMGVFHPSNIQRKLEPNGEAFYYFLGHVEARKNTAQIPLAPQEQQTGVCLYRSPENERLGLPSGEWMAWDGNGFNADPANAEICQVVSKPQIFKMSRSLISLEGRGYLLIGTVGGANPGTYYSFSRDLINWAPRQLLLSHPQPGNTNGVTYAHPSLISHQSRTLDFSTVRQDHSEVYLYMAKFNAGWSLNRDLVRVKIRID